MAPPSGSRMSEATIGHQDLANAVRALAMDAVEKASLGHPGMPMGMADVATVLFTRYLKFDPRRSRMAGPRPFRAFRRPRLDAALRAAASDRLCRHDDRGAAEFPAARQPHGGHPEYGHAPGIETTTGPLGQGLGNAVGMALAERMLAARFGDELVDHHTYVIAGDGCLMEGVEPRGDIARRPSQARQADRALRRQRHLDRRPDLARRL